jgi:hypothetical protein
MGMFPLPDGLAGVGTWLGLWLVHTTTDRETDMKSQLYEYRRECMYVNIISLLAECYKRQRTRHGKPTSLILDLMSRVVRCESPTT